MRGLLIVFISGLCEAIWNIYLYKSKGVTDFKTNAIAVFFLIISIVTFKKTLTFFPLSIAIVLWTGLTLLITIILDMLIYKTKIDNKVAFFMALCSISIIGLNYFSAKH